MHCPLKTWPFGTGRLLGLQYCWLQLSGEPLIQTTSHSTLHFLWSSAIHPSRVKSIGGTVVEIIEGQTDRELLTQRLFKTITYFVVCALAMRTDPGGCEQMTTFTSQGPKWTLEDAKTTNWPVSKRRQETEVDSFYVQCQIHEAVALKLQTGAFPSPNFMHPSYIRHHHIFCCISFCIR